MDLAWDLLLGARVETWVVVEEWDHKAGDHGTKEVVWEEEWAIWVVEWVEAWVEWATWVVEWVTIWEVEWVEVWETTWEEI